MKFKIASTPEVVVIFSNPEASYDKVYVSPSSLPGVHSPAWKNPPFSTFVSVKSVLSYEITTSIPQTPGLFSTLTCTATSSPGLASTLSTIIVGSPAACAVKDSVAILDVDSKASAANNEIAFFFISVSPLLS